MNDDFDNREDEGAIFGRGFVNAMLISILGVGAIAALIGLAVIICRGFH